MPFPRNERFIGRKRELSLLEHTFLNGNGTERTTAVLRGTGGMGKSAIALEYAYRYYKHYTAVFWFDMRKPETITKDLLDVAKRIYPNRHELTNDQRRVFPFMKESMIPPEVVEETRELVQDWLAEEGNEHWLLILDGIDDLEAFSSGYQFYPLSSHGQIIITSCRTDSHRLGSVTIGVDEMDLYDSSSMLLSSAGDYKLGEDEEQGESEACIQYATT